VLLDILATPLHIGFRDAITKDETWIHWNPAFTSIQIETGQPGLLPQKAMLALFCGKAVVSLMAGSRDASHSMELA
jgi:hypothetical protein